MDPNANLAEQEQILMELQPMVARFTLDRHLADRYVDLRERLSELREALYEWLARGGFEPDWSKCPNTARFYGK